MIIPMFSPLTLPSAAWLEQVVGINGTEGIELSGDSFLYSSVTSNLSSYRLLSFSMIVFSFSSYLLLLFPLISYRRILLFGASFRSALSHPCRSITKNYEHYLSSHSISDFCITHPQLYLQSFTGLLYCHCSSHTNSQSDFICMYVSQIRRLLLMSHILVSLLPLIISVSQAC